MSYWATYAIYRKIGSSVENQRYVRVSAMYRAVRTKNGRIDTDSYGRAVGDGRVDYDDELSCYTDSLEGSVTLLVQAGDLVGACVFRPENSNTFDRYQLNVVGESDGSKDYLLEMGVGGCSIDDIPTSIRLNKLSRRNRRRLHIYANIGLQ